MRTLQASSSISRAVTNVADTWSPNKSGTKVYRYISDRNTHIAVTMSGRDATHDDLRVPAECAEFIRVDPGEAVSFIRDDADVDGTVWLTLQDS